MPGKHPEGGAGRRPNEMPEPPQFPLFNAKGLAVGSRNS